MIKNFDDLTRELKNLDSFLDERGFKEKIDMVLIGGTVKFAYADIRNKNELNNTRETPDIDLLCDCSDIIKIADVVDRPYDYIGTYFELPNGTKVDMLSTIMNDDVHELLKDKNNLHEFPGEFKHFDLYVPKLGIYVEEKKALGRDKDVQDLKILKKAFPELD